MGDVGLLHRTSVLVILEKEHVEKIDKVAGVGNRSAYIRWLIDTVDESNIKRELEQEAMVKMLQKLPHQLEKRIVKRDLQIRELKNRLHDLKLGKPEEKDIAGLDEVFESYIVWQANRSGSYAERLSKAPQREWAKIRAQNLDMGVDELLYILEKRERTADVEKISAINRKAREALHGK